MESYGHGHLPRGGRGRFAAARHYSDSKPIKLDSFPSTPEREQGDPELVALHSEFKIQRERLAAWGQEWGDDRIATGETELDDTFERSDLKDAVQDVLENVKDVLDQSEKLSMAGLGGSTPNLKSMGDKKISLWGLSEQKWTPEDRSKYAKLADELKTSIDLLYDISKSRREIRESAYPGFAGKSKSESALPPPISGNVFGTRSYSTSEETLVNTTRSSTARTGGSFDLPSRLDASVLDIPAEEPPPYDSAGATPITRMIAHYRLPAPPSQVSDSEGGSILMPVLIEYAPFDASYRSTGVPVPTNRLDQLMSFHARCGSLPDYKEFSTLSCLGYFEDTKEARFGLVYELPKKALDLEKINGTSIDSRPVSLQKVLQQASKALNANNRMLPPGPPLEDRFRLAFNLVQAFAKMHMEEKLLHKDVNSSNIIFFLKPNSPDQKGHEYDLRAPFVSSFDIFSEFSIEEPPTTPGRNLYRHPHDPKIFSQKCEFCDKSTCQCARYRFDIYGLGLVLLEIGLWGPLSDIFKQKYTLDDFRKRLETVWVRKLATRCGSIYQSVVKECLQQAHENVSEEQMRANYTRWLKKLKRCCLLDEEEEITPTASPTRQTSISGAPIGLSPESSMTASESSSNPFQNLHAATSTSSSSFFSNPFSRFTKKQVPFAIKEEDNNPFHKQDDTATILSRGIDSTVFGSELDVSSTISNAPKYSKAASTIQKAWRSHRSMVAFTEYKRKIVIIQKAWRRRQQQSGSTLRSDDIRIETELVSEVSDFTHIQISHHEAPPKPKLRLHTVKLTQEALDDWHDAMLPKLERICERCLRDSPETVSIDLVGVGETALSAKPTIFITCSSTGRLRGAINRKFHYDHDIFDLRVRRGRVRRSKVNQPRRHAPAHRSMMNGNYSPSDAAPLNPFHQERPLCGASIGAYVGNKHLPPVSYGGVVHIDGEPYGMTVHHLLDTPSDEDDSEFDEQEAYGGAERSSARRTDAYDSMLAGMAGHPTLQSIPTDSMFPLDLEISDDDGPLSSDEEIEDDGGELSDEEYFSSDFESEPESVETDNTRRTLGDLSGVHPGRGTDILVTQPALDDVDEDFFPNEDDRDDDHIDSHKLGCVHASSGIRRWNRQGNDGRSIVHEIDWALLKLDEGRLQPYNLVQGGRKHLQNPTLHDLRTPQLVAKLIEPICRSPNFSNDDDEFPVRVAKSEELGNLRVHCFGRTSGLQGGIVGPAMSSVRIYRRRSFSRSWHVVGNFGVGGDSGAWVIDNDQGRVCGHVLAWCERNAIAYICPMEVLLEDIKRTLGAKRICLPGSEDDVVENTRTRGAQRNQKTIENNKKEMDLPDIARLDFGDRERLGLRGGTAEEIMKRSAASAVLKGLTAERINGSSKGPRMDLQGVIGVS